MKYTISKSNLHIIDSYAVSKKRFEPFLNSVEAIHPDSDVWIRTKKSMCREWALHNLLYALHIARSHTADVDINYPQNWFVSIIYTVFGAIALRIIK